MSEHVGEKAPVVGDGGYKVIEAATREELEAEVSKAMEMGWLCQGGICRYYIGYDFGRADDTGPVLSYAQAMVRAS